MINKLNVNRVKQQRRIKMLSKSNRDKLVDSGLYYKKIRDDEKDWCRNGTYTIKSNRANDRVLMTDTYFETYSVDLTDENFDEFALVMDFNLVTKVGYESYREYTDENRFHFAVDSGGWQYSKYFILKSAKPDVAKRILILKDEIKSSEFFLEQRKKELIKLKEME